MGAEDFAHELEVKPFAYGYPLVVRDARKRAMAAGTSARLSVCRGLRFGGR